MRAARSCHRARVGVEDGVLSETESLPALGDEDEVNENEEEEEERSASRSRRGVGENERRRERERVASRHGTGPRTRARATRAECVFEVVAGRAKSLIWTFGFEAGL